MIRLGLAVCGLGLAAVVLSACESTAQRSAELAKHASRLSQGSGVRVIAAAANVTVVSTTALHDVNGAAAIVALRSAAPKPLYDLPIAIALLDHAGAKLAANDAAGLDPSLTHVAQLAPGQVTYWVDDQLIANGTPARVTAKVGAPASTGAALPALTLGPARLDHDPASGVLATGTLHNGTGKLQATVTIEVVALRGATVIAAGRGAVSNLAAGASAPYRVFFIGNPTGGRLVVSAALGGPA